MIATTNTIWDNATLNTNYFKYNDLFLKGCRKCNKLVDYNHTKEPRMQKESRFVYLCECVECKSPLILDEIDFFLLKGKV